MGNLADELRTEHARHLVDGHAVHPARKADRHSAWFPVARRIQRGSLAVEVELFERDLTAAAEPVRIGGMPLAQYLFRRAGCFDLGARQLVHLGGEAPTDRRVALVQAEAQRLAVENFLTHPAIDLGRKLGIGRRPAHGPFESEGERRLFLAREHDRAIGRIDRLAPEREQAPDDRSGDQEMRERVAQGLADHFMIGGASPGVFRGRSQTGEE